MNTEIKLVAFDLDGTLLNSAKDVLPSSIAIINRLRQHGVKVAICSGRILPMQMAYVKKIKLDGYVISTNGCCIDDINNNKVLFQTFLDSKLAEKIIKFGLAHHLDTTFLTREFSYFSSYSDRIKRFSDYNQHAINEKVEPLRCIRFNRYEPVDKIEKILIRVADSEFELVDSFLKTLDITYSQSEKNLFDIVHSTADKGRGLIRLASILNLSLDNIMVFGDYDNDISMFKVAKKYSVAMANGSKLAKENATYQTRSNDDDGIAIAIKKIVFQED
jgi:Cof subfamily protein (haloacid dehalogenase superfamily)